MATTDDSIKKNISQNIIKYREKAGLSQKELANLLGTTPSRVSNWEQGANCPTIDMLFEVCNILKVSINDIYGVYPNSNIKLSYEEKQYLEKYRFISEHSPEGIKTVDTILNREYTIARQLQERDAQIIGLETEKPTLLHMYTYLHKIACAGKGFYFEDIPVDTMAAPYVDGADFIISVNGDSMEPTYHDGDLVYVQKSQIVNIGDIGIFILNGECYIKEAGEKGLISHNPKYDLIPGNENIICIGRVLERVPEEYTA